MTTRTALGIVKIGGEATFNTAASYQDYVRTLPPDISGLQVDMVDDEHQRWDDYAVAAIAGARTGQLTLKHQLHGISSSIPSAAPSLTSSELTGANAIDHLMQILASLFGQIHTGGYNGSTTVGHDSSPEGITSADLSSFVPGQAVAWATGNAQVPYEVGWLKSVDQTPTPDEGALLQVPRHNPQGTKIWGAVTLFTDTGDPFHDGNCKGWTIDVLGEAADTYYRMTGCYPTSLKISGEAGKPAMMEIAYGVAHWETADTGGAPSAQAWSHPRPEICTPWRVALGDASSTEDLVVQSFEFDLGIQRQALPDGQHRDGVGGFYTVTRRPRVKLQVPRDYARIEDFDAQTARPLTIQWGTQPGKLIALCLPAARLVSHPAPADKNGGLYLDLEYEANVYQSDTSGPASEPANAFCRLAFL